MVITEFEGDEQLVLIWISFLLHNGWMAKPDGKRLITDKGKLWAKKYRNA